MKLFVVVGISRMDISVVVSMGVPFITFGFVMMSRHLTGEILPMTAGTIYDTERYQT